MISTSVATMKASRLERLIVEHFRDAAQKEDARSISELQELAAHQEWARREISRIAECIGLSGAVADALAVGAGLHDEGKKAPRWQRAFKAPREKDERGAYKVFAKTSGPIDQAILGGYRHEFGSLPCVEENAEFKALPDDWRELVLHLVAAHHGQARPVIETRGCEDGPPSLLEERARAVALRFARLQKRWGPWGLAWWEALMRAADQQASRDNEAGETPSIRQSG
jgi:CRISPR-associated endonuclease/helicase Cas3